MAKLAELIDCLSETLGLPRTTIEAYVKPLRKEGFIASAGRSGPGAPDMTATDAVNLLLGILGGSALRVTDNLETYRNLVFFAPPDYEGSGLQSNMAFLELNDRHTFGELIEALVRTRPDAERHNEDMLRDWAAIQAGKKDCLPFDTSTGGITLRHAIDSRYITYCRITVREPLSSASFEFGAMDRRTRLTTFRYTIDYAPLRVVDTPEHDWEAELPPHGDLTTQRSVGSATIRALALLLTSRQQGLGGLLRRAFR